MYFRFVDDVIFADTVIAKKRRRKKTYRPTQSEFNFDSPKPAPDRGRSLLSMIVLFIYIDY